MAETTVQFLSKEWLELLARRLGLAPPVATPRRIGLGQIVSGVRGEVISWTVLVGGGQPATAVPGTDQSQVTLLEDYETARDIAAGGSLAALLAAGRVKLRGDASVLIEGQAALATLGKALRELSSTAER